MLTPNGRYIIPVYFDVDSQIKDIGATYESHDKYTLYFKKVFNDKFKIAAEKFRESTCIDLLPLKINKKSRLTFDWKVLDKSTGSLKNSKNTKNTKNSKKSDNPENLENRDNLQTDFEKLLNTNKKMLRKLKQSLRKKSFRYVDIRSDSHESISSGTKMCGNSLLGRTKNIGPQSLPLPLNNQVNCLGHKTIMSQFMRVLGFDYEHSRFDRDHFMDWFRENTITRYWNRFSRRIKPRSSFYTSYDYASLLQLNGDIYTKNGNLTLKPNFDDYAGLIEFADYFDHTDNPHDFEAEKASNSTDFTPADIYRINSAYPCLDHPRPGNACIPNPCGFNEITGGENICYTSLDGSNFKCMCYDEENNLKNERTCSGICNPNPCKNGGSCRADARDKSVEHCDCPKGSEGKLCETCSKGYYFDVWGSKKCVKNVCECENGVAVKNTGTKGCKTNGLSICQSCDHGYHLSSEKVCVKNECFCQFGEAPKVCMYKK